MTKSAVTDRHYKLNPAFAEISARITPNQGGVKPAAPERRTDAVVLHHAMGVM
jgi:hypothetical protein